MGAWGSYSKKEERYYKNQARKDKQREERRKTMAERIPFRKATLARVKAGEITLEEAQKLIKKNER